MISGGQTLSSFWNSAILASSFSTTASITKSTSRKSSRRVVVLMRPRTRSHSSGLMRPRLTIRSRSRPMFSTPRRHNSSLTSWIRTSKPACPATSATPPPICPDPTMPSLLTAINCSPSARAVSTSKLPRIAFTVKHRSRAVCRRLARCPRRHPRASSGAPGAHPQATAVPASPTRASARWSTPRSDDRAASAAPPTCASSTRSTCSRVSPSAAKISTNPTNPTVPPACSTIVMTLAQTGQVRRISPAHWRQ